MTDQRHPDIEIYIKNKSVSDIEQWLSSLGQLSTTKTAGLTHHYSLSLADSDMPVMIHEKVAGKAWTSLWFKENHTSWDQDLACAEAAASAMATQVRCIASGWNDGDEPDEYWKIENSQTEKIIWRS